MKNVFLVFICIFYYGYSDFALSASEESRAQVNKKDILQDVLEHSTQKNLYFSHFPKEKDIHAHYQEELRFSVDVSNIEPEYIIFYEKRGKFIEIKDCRESQCQNVSFNYDYNLSTNGRKDVINILIKTKNGFYDKMTWYVDTRYSDMSYVEKMTPKENNFSVEINNKQKFEINAHDNKGNLWQIDLYKDDEKISGTGESCRHKTQCSFSDYITFDRFDIGEVRAVITIKIDDFFAEYKEEVIIWKPNIVKDYYQEVTLPKQKLEAEERAIEEKNQMLIAQSKQKKEVYTKYVMNIIIILILGTILYLSRHKIISFFRNQKLKSEQKTKEKALEAERLEKERQEAEEKRQEEQVEQERLQAELERRKELEKRAKKLQELEEEKRIEAQIEIEKQEKIRKEKERIKKLDDEASDRRRREREEGDAHLLNLAKTVKEMFVDETEEDKSQETKPQKKKGRPKKESSKKTSKKANNNDDKKK